MVLVAATLAVYAPVRDFPFVVYDDKVFVTENPPVAAGLSRGGVTWAFTRSHSGNYVPLTWLSHMLDVELFGLEAGPHHVVNVVLHTATALAFLVALWALTGAPGPSLFVAAFFALHPTHVESVAWISERRDVLSGLCFALTLWAHARYARSATSLRWYALIAGCFAAGLLAKPMLVTLPALLLVLDFWPLRRREPLHKLVLEKLPLLALGLAAGLAAVVAQQAGGGLASLEQVPLAERLANALVACAGYLRLTLWPAHLAVFHPLRFDLPAWQVAASALVLAAISAAALVTARRRPYLLAGWLWYLVVLAPVIGIVQVGSQSMAERYTYLSTLGLALAVAFLARELTVAHPRTRRAVAILGVGIACTWALLARAQVGAWRDSVTLFERARAVHGDHPVILSNLAEAFEDAGRTNLARRHYREAIRRAPDAASLRARLGELLAREGDWSAAAKELAEAVRLDSGRLDLRDALGVVTDAARAEELERAGEPGPARTRRERALRLAERAGAEALAERLRAELARAGGAPIQAHP